MYQHLVINAKGIIDAKASVINALNTMSGIENAVMDIGIVAVPGQNHSFAITFNRSEIATSFFDATRELGSLDLSDVTRPKILLNEENSFIYLFNKFIKAGTLLTDPDIPPFARVNLLKLFATQAIEPFIFHGIREDEMKVGFDPIQFKEGKIDIRLRGQTPKNSNTIIDYDNFDELALVCFTDAEMARNIIPLKQLLFAVRTQYVMDNYKGPLEQQLKLHPLKVTSIIVEEMGKRLYLEISNEKSRHKTLKQMAEFKQLLQQIVGDSFRVISSLHRGRSALEITPAEGFLFTDTDVDLLTSIFQKKSEVIFLSLGKEKLVKSLVQLNDLLAEKDEVRYSFESVHALAEAFRDPVRFDTLKNPLVIDKSGISFSATTIQTLIASDNRRNPLTRQPMEDSFRENKLLEALKEHYSRTPAYLVPPMLEGMTTAVILPNGETVNGASIMQLFTEQNNIANEAIQPDTTAKLSDGSTLYWRDVWRNLAVQQIINFYNQPLRLNRDERVLEHPNPMLSLAATISSLLESASSLSKDEAEILLESNPMAIPVHVIWSSDPAGLRLNFKSIELERLILCLLTRNDIAAVSTDAIAPFKKCIFLSSESEQGKENIKKFIYDICKYNRASHYFDSCFSSKEFRYESRVKARKIDEAAVSLDDSSSDVVSLNQEQLVFNFLRAMYYGTMAEVNAHFEALPALLKQGHLGSGNIMPPNRMVSREVSVRIPAASFVTSAHTPLTLLAHVSSGVRSSIQVNVRLASQVRDLGQVAGMLPTSTSAYYPPPPLNPTSRIPSVTATAAASIPLPVGVSRPRMRLNHPRFFDSTSPPSQWGLMVNATVESNPGIPVPNGAAAPMSLQVPLTTVPEEPMDDITSSSSTP